MNNIKENSLIPELRFPEFKNQRTWQIKKLSEILFEHRSKSTGKEIVFSVSVHKGIINQIEHLGRSFSAANTNNYNLVLPGDLVYTKSPTGNFPYGIIKQNTQEKSVIVSPLYGVFTPETRDLGCILHAYFESHSNTFNYLAPIVQKGAKNTINIKNETFLSQSLNVPTDKREQKKIADCLSSLDELINVQIQKIDILKNHKKGLLQNIFPIEKENIPKLRFKEFEKDEEWKEKTLEQIATFFKGKGISKAEVSDTGSIPCIRYGELYTNYKETIDAVISYTNLLKEDLMLSEANDVIIPASGETQIDIATASCVLKDGIALGGDLNIIRTNINGVFLSYFLNNVKKKEIAQLAQGISVVHLYSSQLKTLSIKIPEQKEQEKIAECLFSLENEIEANFKRLKILRDHKIGLMQRLFPNLT